VTLQAIRDSWRDSAVSAIAKAEANAGRYADSLATTRMIENGPDRGGALKHLVDAMVEAGEYEVALTTALGIEDVEVRPMAVAIVAERYARLGRTSESVSAASALDGWGKDEVLRRVMRTQASVGDFERARISADLIQDDSRRIKALAELTVAVSRAGLDASGLLASGLREAGNVDSTFRLEALTDVVISAMQSGLASLAPLVSEVATAAKEAVVGSIGIFSRIASEQAAEEEYSHATNTALMIEDSFYREETLAKIAIAQAVAYDEEGAEETIVKIGSAARRAETWAELGLALARDRRDPQPAFDRATKLALIADPQGDSFGAVKKAVHALCEAGRYGQAIELCDMALGQPYVVLDVIESLDASRPEAEDAMPQILPRAVWSRDAAWTLCGKLVLFFPEQAETLAGKIATYDDR
jgi:tetratricopeptide (TPR) repeat protein